MNEILEAGLWLASMGFAVIPCCSPGMVVEVSCSRKGQCATPGKHPLVNDWPNEATTDQAQIRAWWAQWPQANLAVVTGAISGIFVLDVDDKDNGAGSASLAALEAKYGKLPPTMTVRTGLGWHFYFVYPTFAVNNQVGKIGAGLDIRAERALVIVPPSTHRTGAQYEWADKSVPVAQPPSWLIDLIKGSCNETPLLDDVEAVANYTPLDQIDTIRQGTRNNTLHKFASSMRGKGMDADEIEDALLEINKAKCSPPLPRNEVADVARSVRHYTAGKRSTANLGVLKGKDRLIWMKTFPSDILSDRMVMLMTDYQFGWRMRLWLEAWRSGGILPRDPAVLCKLARAGSFEQFNDEMDIVLHDFEEHVQDGEPALINQEVAELYETQMARYKQKCEAAAKALEAKKSKAEGEKGKAKDDSEA